jgi:hypothetical protein
MQLATEPSNAFKARQVPEGTMNRAGENYKTPFSAEHTS